MKKYLAFLLSLSFPLPTSPYNPSLMSLSLSYALLPPPGSTYPNPRVGCVITNSNSQVIGAGFHPRAGECHAEIFALMECGGMVESGVMAAIGVCVGSYGVPASAFPSYSASDCVEASASVNSIKSSYISSPSAFSSSCSLPPNSSAYVTLEPCSHVGRTPPCCATLVNAGVSNVYVGYIDSNPLVSGGGIKFLRDNGVNVVVVNDEACRDANEEFFGRMRSMTIEPMNSIDFNGITSSEMKALRKVSNAIKSTERGMKKIHVKELPLTPTFMHDLSLSLLSSPFCTVKCSSVSTSKSSVHEIARKVEEGIDGVKCIQVIGRTFVACRVKGVDFG